MNTRRLVVMRSLWLGVGAAAILAAGCAGLSTHKLTMLTGAQEVPPVTTKGSATADISVDSFKCPSAASSNNCPTVLGTVTTSGMTGGAAEIPGAAGQNGPVIVSLIKTNDHTWSIPIDTTLTDAENDAYWAGKLYVTVATAAHKGGEIRAQLRP